MPRPFTKAQIVSESQKEYNALVAYLTPLTPDTMTAPGVLGDWSVKDILFHLYEWQQMVLDWLAAGQSGETPHVPANGFKWSQIPALNQQIYEKYRDRPLSEATSLFGVSHEKIMATIQSLPEEEIFTAARYPWMNQNTLAAYFVSCTSSHYRWALKEIRGGIKARQKAVIN